MMAYELSKYDNKTLKEIRDIIKKSKNESLSWNHPLTLESIKKSKNFLACIKGYPIDPEGYTYETLRYRFYQELDELNEIENLYINGQINFDDYKKSILSEYGDLSNIIDYITSKIICNYPDKYKGVGDD